MSLFFYITLKLLLHYQGLPKKNGDPIAGQIAANRGKIRQITLAITFLKNRDRSHRRGHSRKQWRSLWRWNLTLFGVHDFSARRAIFFFNLRYRGGLGPGLYPTKLYDIFYQIFKNLSQYFFTSKGFNLLKYDKIQTLQIDYLSHFLISGWTMIKICTVWRKFLC